MGIRYEMQHLAGGNFGLALEQGVRDEFKLPFCFRESGTPKVHAFATVQQGLELIGSAFADPQTFIPFANTCATRNGRDRYDLLGLTVFAIDPPFRELQPIRVSDH
ncbi:hypothetical protein QAD02_019732 [Eretmocerus hayati]|uniref:Uncharacterized protein n=1 Tax=Eretmocerus hayati TaxID=131215 RepID=A0ACC2PQ78_9HYME|nr:hypothetical protein QAD02_019732 [Eretmocerus hayati]